MGDLSNLTQQETDAENDRIAARQNGVSTSGETPNFADAFSADSDVNAYYSSIYAQRNAQRDFVQQSLDAYHDRYGEAAAGELGVSIRAPRLPSIRFAAQSAAAVDRAGKAGCGVAPSGDWNDIGEQAAEIVDMVAQGTNSRSSIHATLRAWPSWPTPLRQQAAKLG
jgi:hypothetical protein